MEIRLFRHMLEQLGSIFMSLLGRHREKRCRHAVVARHTPAVGVQPADVDLSHTVALLRRLAVELVGFLEVLRHALGMLIFDSKLGLGLGVAVPGGRLESGKVRVPFGRTQTPRKGPKRNRRNHPYQLFH